VSAWANWRLTIPKLAERFRVIAPDILGFGYTDCPQNITYTTAIWLEHLTGFLDALEIEQASVVGNSFGGGLALRLALTEPDRVRRLVLMGSVGVHFDITDGLDTVWGYKPSLKAMREMMDIFAYDKTLLTEELAQLRYDAATRPGVSEAYSSMFPEPRQRVLDAMSLSDLELSKISQDTLIIHGRDDAVIPLEASEKLVRLIDHSQLHVFGQCGHWVQIEQAARFEALVREFLSE
jgi:2-hydroxymuconate-semialdehyde hydrolase